MTHTDLLRQALDALELQEPAVGCPREREHWKRTAMPTIAALRAALAQPETQPVNQQIESINAVFDAWRNGEDASMTLGLATPQAQPAPAVQVVLRQPNLFAADPAAPAVNCEWTNCPRRVGDVCCNERAAPAVPADMVMVPREPTLNMLAALSGEWHSSRHEGFRVKYRAMIAAAPGSAPAAPAVPAVNCEWTNCPRRVGDVCCNERAAPAVREPHEPYLCIKPACGPDCSGCNCAISPQDMRDYAVRYAILRNAPIDAIRAGGVFAGKTPDNVVINGEHLDAAVDALRGITGDSK